MTVTITPDRDFAALARSFNERTARRMVVSGVNALGKTLRTELPASLEAQLGARKIRSRSRARAAYAGSDKPTYRLVLPRYVSVFDTKTLRFKRSGKGRQRRGVFMASFRDFDRQRVVFRATRREGKGKTRRIRLLATPTLPERSVGPIQIPTSLLDDRAKFPAVPGIVDRGRDAAVAAMAASVTKALSRRR